MATTVSRGVSLSSGMGDHNSDDLVPDLDQARRTANVAHNVVIKLKKMGLPASYDEELARLSTDLGDLWSAQKLLSGRLDSFLESTDEWEDVGDRLVDLRSSVDHIAWHLRSVRRPLSRITRFAYHSDRAGEKSDVSR